MKFINRYSILLLCLVASVELCFANMASPYVEGTVSGSAFSSRDIDILGEKITIITHTDFTSASYIVEYTIRADANFNNLIPLLFYAVGYKGDFKVWLDGKEILIRQIPDKYLHFKNSPFEGFERYNSNGNNYAYNPGDPDDFELQTASFTNAARINDLKFFEAKIDKGVHYIRVTYTAMPTVYLWHWVKEYTFDYSLSPARHWKSFGTLEVVLEQQGEVQQAETNLGVPTGKEIKAKTTWKFNTLPDDFISITLTPKVSLLATALIYLSPFGLSVIMFTLLLYGNYLLILRARKLKPYKKPLVYYFGIIIVPFLAIFGYLLSYGIIDLAIGEQAGRRHGYIIFSFVLYPLFVPLYWLIIRYFERKIVKRIQGNP